jgi:hypothetical protein
MNLSESDKIYGLETGIQYGQNARVDELNERALARFVADTPLQPNIARRPIPTKYARFPIIDRVADAHVPIRSYLDYSTGSAFAPIQGNGPFSGFKVCDESNLRNQYFALQTAPQAAYIPSSSSELYKVTMAPNSRPEPQPFLGLFDDYRMNPFSTGRNVDPKIGSDTFLNNTRVQLRGGALA